MDRIDLGPGWLWAIVLSVGLVGSFVLALGAAGGLVFLIVRGSMAVFGGAS